jgi:hypothetical protein
MTSPRTPGLPRRPVHTLVFGPSRVGKTTAIGRWLNTLWLRPPPAPRKWLGRFRKRDPPRPAVGMAGFCVKVGEGHNLVRTALAVRPPEDVIWVQPGPRNPWRFDPLVAYCGLRGATPAGATDMMNELADLAGRFNQRPEESFWALGRMRVLYFCLVTLIGAFRRPRVEQLYRFLTELPASPKAFERVDGQPSAYERSFCGRVMRQAIAEADDALVAELTRAKAWLTEEWAAIPDKTRESYRQSCLNVVFPYTQEPIASLCGGDTLSLDRIADGGQVVVLDVPVLRFGLPAVLYQGAFKYLLDRHMTDRPDDARPVYAFVDEYQWLAMPRNDVRTATIAAQSRYHHCYLTQSVQTLLEAFGGTPQAQAQLDSLLSNSLVKAFHWTDDHRDQQLMAQLSGQTKRLMLSGNGGDPTAYDPWADALGTHRGAASVQFSEAWEPVFRPEHALTLQRGGPPRFACDVLLFEAGAAPRIERIPQLLFGDDR